MAVAGIPPSGPAARFALSIDAPAQRLEPSGAAQLLLRVGNTGDGQNGARLQLASPAGLGNLAWTCQASAGARCSRVSGQGDIDESLDGLVAGGALEYRINANVTATPPAFVRLRAQMQLPQGARCADDATAPCHTELSLPTGPNLRLSVQAATPAAVPAQQVRYTIELRPEASDSNNAGTVLRSPLPKGLLNATWTCRSDVGACAAPSGSGDIEQVLGDFSAADVRFEVKATVAANPPGTIVAAAVAIPPYGGSCAGAPGSSGARSSPCTARAALATSARIFASRGAQYSRDGTAFTQRFMLENRGATANGSAVSLDVPADVSALTWTCKGVGATCPQASGSGSIQHVVANWPSQGTLRYDVTALRNSPAAGWDLQMQVVPAGSGSCAAAERKAPCLTTESTTLEHGHLHLTQQSDRLGAGPGDTVTFTVVAGNDSEATLARDLVLDIPLPQGIARFDSWTCAADGATACPQTSGSGPVHQFLADLAPSSRLVYALTAQVGDNAPATVVGLARLTAPADASLGCRSPAGANVACVARSEFSTVPVLALDQSGMSGSLDAGGAARYAFEVVNHGADASNVRISDNVPIGFSTATWACAGMGIGCPAASGSGKVSTTVAQMPTGSGLRYEVTGRMADNPPPTISTVVRAQPDTAGRCHRSGNEPLSSAPCLDRSETHARPVLALAQTSSEHQLLRGGVANFRISLDNVGSTANGSVLHVAVPEGVERSDWTCSGRAGAVCPAMSGSGPIEASIAELPAQGGLDYAVRAVLDQQIRTSIVSIASVTPPSAGECAGDGCKVSLALPVALVPAAHLDMAIASERVWAPPGSSPQWVVEVRNLGAETATDLGIETLTAGTGLSIAGWTCAGVECPVLEGVGAIDLVVPKLTVYDESAIDPATAPGRLLFTVTGRLDMAPGPKATLSAKLAPSTGDTCAPVACVATSEVPTDPRGSSEVTLDLQAEEFEALPNSTINYTYSISNTGGAGIKGLLVTNAVPPEIVSQTWTCVPFSEASCPPDGSGPINEILPFVPVQDGLTFFIQALTGPNVQPSVDYRAGVDPDAGVFCVPVSCEVELSLPGPAELTLTLDADVSVILPDSSVRYTYRIENTGGGSTSGLNIFTIEPPEFLSSTWTCVAEGDAFCEPSGIGPIDEFSFIANGSALTFTIDALVGSELPPTLRLDAGVEPGGQPGVPPDGPNGLVGPPLNCVPPSCTVSLELPTQPPEPPRLSISKTADRTQLEPGGTVRYTVRVANTGQASVGNLRLVDSIPAGLDSFAWTCSATGDAFCFESSGSGSIDQFIEVLAPGGALIYTVDATVSAAASGGVTNRALLVAEGVICAPISCQGVSSLPVGPAPTVSVNKTATPPSGVGVAPGGAIGWTLVASNAGGPTSAPVVLTDVVPASATGYSVVADSGVTCNTLAPPPGSSLVCTIAAGFSGDRGVEISATVADSASGQVSNTVSASGADNPVCVSCSVSNPVLEEPLDVALSNPRAFSAGGIAGTLFDVVNLSSIAVSPVTVRVTPPAALRLFSAYAGGCTATVGDNGEIEISCPNPPSAQGISCSGNTCTVASLAQGSASTLFVALNAGSSATVSAVTPGDGNTANNSLVLPPGGTP
jgi:uncharacterized repeat protein (TIGR01451 family)